MAAVKKLQQELKSFTKDPLDGVNVEIDDGNLFLWKVTMFGPPDSIFTGGCFKAELKFPEDYPFSAPEMKFQTPLYHPNIYQDGRVCISILHPPGVDEMSGERPEERWNPTQTVKTIILSVISILNEPNISSPANVDASVAFRKWKAGEDMAYERRVRTEVAASKKLAEDEGLNIPLTMEEYLNSSISDKYVMCPEGKVQLTSASSRSVRIGREWMPLPTSQRTKTTTMIRTWET
eukprot:TRINITY_DN11416_c3_g2_i2.p1 TRINITY_DN11416_c3_g2~~TRINITY_DN11416_c3_g2_i2.p1  ORF type:complete len:235 (+),score=37.03 TRINITY_DN11416_c3_g2_i2:234-938(+)